MAKIYKIEIPDTIIRIYAIFDLVGLWKIRDGITSRQYFYFTYLTLLVVSVFLCACLSDDGEEFVFLMVTTFVGTVQACRMYYLIRKQNEVLHFTQEADASSTNDYDVFSGVAKKLKTMMTFIKFFNFTLLFAFVAVVLLPVTSGEKRLIFNIAFPLNYKASERAFLVAYTFVSFGFVLSASCCVYSVIMWYLMLTFIIKYEILGNQLKHLGMDTVAKTKVGRNLSIAEKNGSYVRQIIAAIKAHENIYEYRNANPTMNNRILNNRCCFTRIIDKFASTFSNLFLLQIFSSSICICGSVHTLAFSSHENLFQDAFYCVVLFYSLADIFMVMYLANEIKLTSDKLSFCIYESDWTVQTESCKKYFLIVVERLKQPQELVVGKIFPLNIESFTAIVNRAYSMFNILQNLRK